MLRRGSNVKGDTSKTVYLPKEMWLLLMLLVNQLIFVNE